MPAQAVKATGASEPVVYVVDDDAAVRGAVEFLIRSFGREVHGFASGEAFLAAYRPGGAACLVLDLHMPGMSGLELQEQLLARGIQLPVVMITAHRDDPLLARSAQLGIQAVLSKPFRDEDLLRNIDEALKH